jgi:hypothetical protein
MHSQIQFIVFLSDFMDILIFHPDFNKTKYPNKKALHNYPDNMSKCLKVCSIIGTILNPTTSIDVIAATIRMPLIVWFIFFSQ